ncbi:MAG: general secretion pathway protein GspB, partial [Gammaproteobacteria bacterium]|nr:general secretion pathway protein GspB [Gammaproteobacteria bacterium]
GVRPGRVRIDIAVCEPCGGSYTPKDEIPSIFFSSYSWSSNAGERMVTLNREVRREGDAVLPGLRLVEILPESIVLDFQGTRFRLRALNSWVNL